MRNGADQCRTPLVDFLEEVCPQRLVAELGTFDRKSSVVGIGREQPPVVDVERPATQDEEPDRAARGRQRYLSQQRAGDDAAGERRRGTRDRQEAVQ